MQRQPAGIRRNQRQAEGKSEEKLRGGGRRRCEESQNCEMSRGGDVKGEIREKRRDDKDLSDGNGYNMGCH